MPLIAELQPGGALREAVVALAYEAAAAILDVYEGGFAVEHKSDASPLTAADMAAHRCIVAGLGRLTPEVPVLSEESAHEVPTALRRSWRRLWVVDPLDGTREFVKRNGEFTVNIALVDDGVPVFGVVQAPVTGIAWHAARGGDGLRRQGPHGGDTVLRTRAPAAAPWEVAASRSHRDARTQAMLERIGDATPVPLGSSLKFCRLAEGGMDVYPRFGPTSEWDTAAGQCILEAAGGCVIDLQGRPFRYNQRDTVLNGDFLALGDPDVDWRGWLDAPGPAVADAGA